MNRTYLEILDKFKQKHGNNYNYSLFKESDYINSLSKITIICEKHGSFKQQIKRHLSGCGCYWCKHEKHDREKSINNLKNYIEKVKKIHNNKYDYSLINTFGWDQIVKIICPKHGVFNQNLKYHLKGRICPNCQLENKLEEYKKLGNEIHNNKYNYELVSIKDFPKANIICPIHGIFELCFRQHVKGQQCPECGSAYSTSLAENQIKEFIKNNYEKQVFKSKKIIKNKEIDIFLPEEKIAFEYNGLYWHSENKIDKNYHIQKTKLCEKQNIHLIHIFEDEYKYCKEIVLFKILKILNKTVKIDSDSLFISNIKKEITKKFLKLNNFYFDLNTDVNLGLFDKNELIAVLLFKKLNNNNYELVSVCEKKEISIINGVEKLFNHFLINYKPKKIICFLDRNWYSSFKNFCIDLNFNLISKTRAKKRTLIDEKSKFQIYNSGYLKYVFINGEL
jgi:hypothetical protein